MVPKPMTPSWRQPVACLKFLDGFWEGIVIEVQFGAVAGELTCGHEDAGGSGRCARPARPAPASVRRSRSASRRAPTWCGSRRLRPAAARTSDRAAATDAGTVRYRRCWPPPPRPADAVPAPERSWGSTAVRISALLRSSSISAHAGRCCGAPARARGGYIRASSGSAPLRQPVAPECPAAPHPAVAVRHSPPRSVRSCGRRQELVAGRPRRLDQLVERLGDCWRGPDPADQCGIDHRRCASGAGVGLAVIAGCGP